MTKSWVEKNVLKNYHLNDIVEVSLHDNRQSSDQGHDAAHTRVGYLHRVTSRSIWITTLKPTSNAASGDSYKIPYERINSMHKAKLV